MKALFSHILILMFISTGQAVKPKQETPFHWRRDTDRAFGRFRQFQSTRFGRSAVRRRSGDNGKRRRLLIASRRTLVGDIATGLRRMPPRPGGQRQSRGPGLVRAASGLRRRPAVLSPGGAPVRVAALSAHGALHRGLEPLPLRLRPHGIHGTGLRQR